MSITHYLSELFSSEDLGRASLVSIEFESSHLKPAEIQNLLKAFECEMRIRSKKTGSEASILLDLIPDKATGHKYSPILHSAHTSAVTDKFDTYQVLLNFRINPTTEKTQKMFLKLKSPDGEVLKTLAEEIPFNSTSLYSFKKLFGESYTPGSKIDFKGGDSQFAIFNLFYNEKSGAIGMEHSLPPYYYCSDIYKMPNRNTFIKEAFADIGDPK